MALLSILTLITQQVDYTDMPVGGDKWTTESFIQVIRSQVAYNNLLKRWIVCLTDLFKIPICLEWYSKKCCVLFKDVQHLILFWLEKTIFVDVTSLQFKLLSVNVLFIEPALACVILLNYLLLHLFIMLFVGFVVFHACQTFRMREQCALFKCSEMFHYANFAVSSSFLCISLCM